MGHERVGALPRTKRWQGVVEGISSAASADGDVRDLFKTNLQGVRSKEETQRSRPFLYGTIAFALATAFGRDRFCIYEICNEHHHVQHPIGGR